MQEGLQHSEQGLIQEHREGEVLVPISVPQRTLLVLCGAAGCGKSTFARRLVDQHSNQGLRSTTIISSDECRALVCDDENNQQVSRDAFDLFHYIIHKRMFQNRFTIADSTALQVEARYRILGQARQHNYYTCLLVFNVTVERCIQNDQIRSRKVGADVIRYHTGLLQQALRAIPNEGWHQVHILNEQSLHVPLEIVSKEQEKSNSQRSLSGGSYP